jgi:protein gp37
MTKIQWTKKTWNPFGGCMVVSPGCSPNCYAMKIAYRLGSNPLTPYYKGLAHLVNGHAVWTGKATRFPDAKFYEPLGWKKPAKVFVNSMSDLFFEAAPEEWINDAFDVMRRCPQHMFQALTKRPERMRDYMRSREPLPHLWLGVSVEDQRRARERLPILLETLCQRRAVARAGRSAPLAAWPRLDHRRRRERSSSAAVRPCLGGGRPAPVPGGSRSLLRQTAWRPPDKR